MGHRKGFTLLELIIVIIIVGVLASLALPRFFRVIEYSRSAEALVNIAALRQAVERCYLMQGGGSYMPNCQLMLGENPSKLDIDNPTNLPGSHFSYIVNDMAGIKYMISAYRTTFEAPSGVQNQCSYVRLYVHNDDTITREGFNVCAGIQ